MFIQGKIDEYAGKIADNIGCRRDQVREILSRRTTSGEKINYDTGSIEYRAAEFDALSGRASVTGTEYDDFKRIGNQYKKIRHPICEKHFPD